MNTFHLSENHLFFNCENDIKNICKTTLESRGVDYFNFLRIYNDGRAYILSTQQKLIRYLFEIKCPLVAPVQSEIVSEKFQYLVFPTGGYKQLIHHAKSYFNLTYFIDFVERHTGYFDLYCFAAATDNSNILNFYMNNIELFENFKSHFKETAAPLIKLAEENTIILSEDMSPPFYGFDDIDDKNINKKNSTQNNKYYLTGKYKAVHLSKRQIDCISYLAHGFTIKEIANKMSLSPKTVEHHLENIKSKFDCYRKSQIIDIFLKYFPITPEINLIPNQEKLSDVIVT